MKCNSFFCCLLFTTSANLFTTAKAQAVDVNDSLALVDLYNSTNGPEWRTNTNWLTTEPVSTWYGITVTGTRVTQISIGYLNNVKGPIPASIGNLTELERLDLSSEQLTGTIPSTIGNLVKLQYLNLDDNQLTGSIPSSIGNLISLKAISLYNNQLSGSIPAEITNLTNLQSLGLFNNQLTGSIPKDIGKLTLVQSLVLSGNQLTGSIPESIGKLSSVNWLSLGNNQLTGSIPTSIGDLVQLNDQLDLSYNQLTGPIPSSIGNLVRVGYLFLGNNQLSGIIPAELGNLAELGYLNLNNNQLSGTIPSTIGKLHGLGYLYLNDNQLSGEIPASFRYLNRLFFINLSHNQLVQNRNLNFDIPVNSQVKGYVNYNLFTFDGLQLIAQKYPGIQYAPQSTVLPIHQNGNTLSVYAGGFLEKNTYTWHKAGTADSTVIKHDSTFTPTESGSYYVVVHNAIAQKTKLHSDTIDFVLAEAKQKSNPLTAKKMQHATLVKHMQVYPNPASNIVHIQTNGAADVVVTNSSGKVLLTKSINSTGEINISTFANGVYYIQNKTTGEVQKVVVVH